jgi:hypothetical protein
MRESVRRMIFRAPRASCNLRDRLLMQPSLSLRINRAPVLTLWATVVAGRLGLPELEVDHVGADRLDGHAVAACARQWVGAHRRCGIERRGRHTAAGELACMPRRAGSQFEHRCPAALSCTVSRNQGRQRVALRGHVAKSERHVIVARMVVDAVMTPWQGKGSSLIEQALSMTQCHASVVGRGYRSCHGRDERPLLPRLAPMRTRVHPRCGYGSQIQRRDAPTGGP